MINKIKELMQSLNRTIPMGIVGVLLAILLFFGLLMTSQSLNKLDTKTSEEATETHIIHVHPDIEQSLDYDPYHSVEAD